MYFPPPPPIDIPVVKTKMMAISIPIRKLLKSIPDMIPPGEKIGESWNHTPQLKKELKILIQTSWRVEADEKELDLNPWF